MAQVCLPSCARSTAARARSAASAPRIWTHLTLLAVLLASLLAPAQAAQAEPQLSLPTPPGQRWKVIQGYGCGTHSGAEDQFALDLVNMDGATMGAPVRAAADGAVWVWVPHSGTLILSHGGGFYTQYTHLKSAASTKVGTPIKRGELVGWAGDRATRGLPHLHFMAFRGKGVAASGRHSVPLSFAEGYDLPSVGGCNQHAGQVLKAGGKVEQGLPGISFSTSAEVGRWYNADQQITVAGSGITGGYSLSWEGEPAGQTPASAGAASVAVSLAQRGEGLHTLYVRGWDASGQQTLATYGPFGLDLTAPLVSSAPVTLTLEAGEHADLSWPAAEDRASGVAGYRVYIGADPSGTSPWFVTVPQVKTEALAPGTYLLRVQPLDYAGNTGAWTTVSTLQVE